MGLIVEFVPAFADNYIFLVIEASTLSTAAVDPGEATSLIKILDRKNLKLDQILLTHHHADHVGGVQELSQKYDCEVIGFEGDKHRLPCLTRTVVEGDRIEIGQSHCQVMSIPGHTLGHIAFWFPNERFLFCGDTLFSLGCGRLFEGSPQQMWGSLTKIKSLPDETLVYCAHEYTLANGRFALHLDPSNKELKDFLQKAEKLRSQDLPTLPVSLGEEKRINPFLRPLSTEILKSLGISTEKTPLESFTAMRNLKNIF
ncbi:MAG: hydroxyacylglutathione hydrolase [Bdellovibrionales bacterium]|nr:hydroxyacylglutathione hydrolase [Bdellovibrionales bacterium]